jgi:hypothetical protein
MVKNDSLLELLQGNNSLISGKVIEIEIKRKKSLCVSITIELLYSKQYLWAQLNFIDVREYSFYYNKENGSYNIERYKFFRCNEGGFYLSLDPVSEDEEISDEDQDFVLSSEIAGFLYS